MYRSQQDDLQYCDARVADSDDKKATDTDRVPSSPPHLACFTGSSKWLKWLPNRSRQTISELVLVDNDPDWTADSLETLVADLSEFTGLESLHVQAGSGALNDRLSPSAAMAFVGERVSWLKELTLCYYDHCPCLSLAMEVRSFSSLCLSCRDQYLLLYLPLIDYQRRIYTHLRSHTFQRSFL